MWREELCRGFCRMDVEPSQHVPNSIRSQRQLIILKIVASATLRGYAGNEQFTVFSTEFQFFGHTG
jgi:hypothetical protein